jgi:hypothetical protein
MTVLITAVEGEEEMKTMVNLNLRLDQNHLGLVASTGRICVINMASMLG